MNPVFVILAFLPIFSADVCCRIGKRDTPNYALMKFDVKSSQSVLSRKNVRSIDDCRRFASSKKALAFNFIYNFKKINETGKKDSLYNANCQVLDCPEINNYTTIVNETGYAYYSLYLNHHNPETGTLFCVPKVGLFAFIDAQLNYTDAFSYCKNLNGSLAHVASEKRTEGLAKYVRDAPMFVGLYNFDRGQTWKNAFDEPLNCFEYRGWGENEPTKKRGCVGLMRVNAVAYWQIVTCDRTLKFFCEMRPLLRYTRRLL